MEEEKFQLVERRTYVSGRLKGQYIGYESYLSSSNPNEKYYDLAVINGDLFAETVYEWDKVEESQFINNELSRLKIPEYIKLHRLDEGDVFDVNLKGVRIIDFHLRNRQVHGSEIYGDITANIVGYFVHEDKVPLEEVVADKSTVIVKKKETQRRGYRIKTKKYANGSWGFDLFRDPNSLWFRGWNWLSNIIWYIILGLFFIPALIAGWPVFLGILGVLLIYWIFSFSFSFLIRRSGFVWSFLGLLFFLTLFSKALELFKSNVIESRDPIVRDDDFEIPKPKKKERQLVTGEFIEQQLVWKDYDQQLYKGIISVRTSDWFDAKNARNNLGLQLQSEHDYAEMLNAVYLQNMHGMQGIIQMYDSIFDTLAPSRSQFAEIIVSSIQEVPYYLLLPGRCSPDQYPIGSFENRYLSESDLCTENVKYGLLGPIEFGASLEGDCDTRSLLLFTILKHYGYNVMLMSSQTLSHAVIAVELSNITGNYFTYQGRRFYWWETTEPRIPPGLFPERYCNTSLWTISLI